MKIIPDSIKVKIKATHFSPFINKNALKYTEKAVTKGAKSWIAPFKKPQLVAHNKNSDPIGRIVDYKIVKNPNDDNYVQLIAKITDKAAIEKVLDGRYNTVSVGSKSARVICSECDQVLTEDGLCEHKKGTYNEKGELIYWIIDQIEYTEDSFVNEPADEYSGIEEIDIGSGWTDYNTFLDTNSSNLINMEDSMADAKLSIETRNKLADSSFCGPGRSFPAHDKAHITAGLKLLELTKFTDSTKNKIKAALYRKGKRFGIVPSQDELTANPDCLIFGVDDEWTTEQKTEVENYFKENPDADLPETENSDSQIVENTDPETMKKEELRDYVKKLQKEIEDSKKISTEAINLKDSKIEELNKKISDQETLSLQKENELNQLADEVAVLSSKLRDSIISNIVDLQLTDTNEERKTLTEKYSKRKIESLIDTLNDVRSEKLENKDNINTDEPLKNAQTDKKNSDKTQNINDSNDKFQLLFRDRSVMEE